MKIWLEDWGPVMTDEDSGSCIIESDLKETSGFLLLAMLSIYAQQLPLLIGSNRPLMPHRQGHAWLMEACISPKGQMHP